MSITVTIEAATSEFILEAFIGRACAKGDEFIAEVQDAGGISTYLGEHLVYSDMGPSHKATATKCYYSERMRRAFGEVRQTAEDENLIVYPVDPETGESVPWSDVDVTP